MKTYREYLNESLAERYPTPSVAFKYANEQKRRIPELEDIILMSDGFAYLYAIKVIKGRWPEIESRMMRTGNTAEQYAQYVIRGRWPVAEEKIKADEYAWGHYLKFLDSKYPTEEAKMEWIDEGVTVGLVEILNYLGMDRNLQEYLIKKRPDLIGHIQNLDLELKAKYSHERELGKVDL